MNSTDSSCPIPIDVDVAALERDLRRLQRMHPIAFRDLAAAARDMRLDPPALAILLETVELRDRGRAGVTPTGVWGDAINKYINVMRRAVRKGSGAANRTTFVKGDWAHKLATVGRPSLLGAGWNAFAGAMGVQEFNASMGLVSAAPTGGASGTVPGTLVAVGEALGADDAKQVAALLVAGLVGRVAFGRGPVSGAQAGCGGEVGVAAGMAAGGVVHLLGGSWEEIDAAAGLAGTPFVGLECSPTLGLVEYPCVPRNGFAALCAIAAAEAACAGIVPPYGLDETFDRIFAWGGQLPVFGRENETGHWSATACRSGGCNNCGSK